MLQFVAQIAKVTPNRPKILPSITVGQMARITAASVSEYRASPNDGFQPPPRERQSLPASVIIGSGFRANGTCRSTQCIAQKRHVATRLSPENHRVAIVDDLETRGTRLHPLDHVEPEL